MKNKTFRTHLNTLSTIEISVIIPAHNAEKTLRRAVESACRELGLLSGKSGGFPEAGSRAGEGNPEDAPALRYEVLIVENGSEDGTEFLARTLELEHPGEVRFLRSEKGVSNARNRGLEEARGTWVLFLDADDYLLEGAGSVLLDDLHFTGTDLIVHSYEAGNRRVHVCGPEGERYTGKPVRTGAQGKLSGTRDITGKTAGKTAGDSAGAVSGKKLFSGKQNVDDDQSQTGPIEEIIVRMIEDPTRYTAVWSKLFRRERIEYGRLRFDPNLRLSEDSHFLIRYLFLCRRIRLSDRPVYHYSTDNVSVVRKWDGKKEEGYRDSLIAVRACLQTQPLSVRQAFSAYGLMQFNLLMVREVFSLDSPEKFLQKIRRMKEIREDGPFAEAFLGFDAKRHKGARFLPIRLIKSGLYPAAAAVYEARVMQNAKKERS
ncbi:MAG: glycosyltransferase family 2 protein [Sarcina sp.]|nr:glycosyltransferase family 2 protein [Sarcina sp.]